MHSRVIWAIARKDALDLVLNKSTLVGLLFPIILSLVWLLISKVVGGSTTNILAYDPGNSNIVQVVAAAFASPKVTEAGSAAEVTSAFGPSGTHKAAQYALGLIVPAGMDDSLRSGAHPQLQLYLDGSKVNAQTQRLVLAEYSHPSSSSGI